MLPFYPLTGVGSGRFYRSMMARVAKIFTILRIHPGSRFHQVPAIAIHSHRWEGNQKVASVDLSYIHIYIYISLYIHKLLGWTSQA